MSSSSTCCIRMVRRLAATTPHTCPQNGAPLSSRTPLAPLNLKRARQALLEASMHGEDLNKSRRSRPCSCRTYRSVSLSPESFVGRVSTPRTRMVAPASDSSSSRSIPRASRTSSASRARAENHSFTSWKRSPSADHALLHVVPPRATSSTARPRKTNLALTRIATRRLPTRAAACDVEDHDHAYSYRPRACCRSRCQRVPRRMPGQCSQAGAFAHVDDERGQLRCSADTGKVGDGRQRLVRARCARFARGRSRR